MLSSKAFEANLCLQRSLEQQLTSSLHNIAMLKAKVSQEEKISTKEVGRLNELRKNAKDEEDKRQHRGLQTKVYHFFIVLQEVIIDDFLALSPAAGPGGKGTNR